MLQTWLNIPFWTLIHGGFQPFEPVICTKCMCSVADVEAQTGQEAACLL